MASCRPEPGESNIQVGFLLSSALCVSGKRIQGKSNQTSSSAVSVLRPLFKPVLMLNLHMNRCFALFYRIPRPDLKKVCNICSVAYSLESWSIASWGVFLFFFVYFLRFPQTQPNTLQFTRRAWRRNFAATPASWFSVLGGKRCTKAKLGGNPLTAEDSDEGWGERTRSSVWVPSWRR